MEKTKEYNKFVRFFIHLWRIFGYIPLYTIATYFLVIIAVVIETLSGITIIGDDKTAPGYLLMILLSAALMIALMWLLSGKEWKKEGFWRIDKLSAASIGIGAGLGLSMSLAINSLFGTLLSIASIGEPEREFMVSTYGSSLLAVITTCMVVPVVEEVIYRGTVLKRLRELRVALPLALIIQAVLFGVAHTEGIQIFYAAITCIVDGIIYLRTGSIWGSIISHAAFNALSIVFVSTYNRNNDAHSIIWFLCFAVSVAVFIVLMRIHRKRFPIPPVAAEVPAEQQCACGLTATEPLCPDCGQPATVAADGTVCPECGAAVESRGQFCGICGKEL